MTAVAMATAPSFVRLIKGGRQGVFAVTRYLREDANGIEPADPTDIAPERVAALMAVLERADGITISGDGTRPAPGREAEWLTESLGRGEHRTGALGAIITVGKSLSILAESDPDIYAIVAEALNEASATYAHYMIEHSQIQRKKDGKIYTVPVDPSSLRAVEWLHSYSAAGDAHLHAHVLISTSVRAEGDDRPRALDTRHFLEKVAPMAGAAARATLVRVLREHGIEVDPLTLELAGLTQKEHDLLTKFSQMRDIIQDYESHGMTGDTAWRAARQGVKGDPSHPVNTDADTDQVGRVHEAVADWLDQSWTIEGPDGPMVVKISKAEALEHALDGLIKTPEGRKAVCAYQDQRSGGAWGELVAALEVTRSRKHEYTLEGLTQALELATDAGQTITPAALAGHAHVISASLDLDEVVVNDYLVKRFIRVPGRRGLVAAATVEADLALVDGARAVMVPAIDAGEALTHRVGLTVVNGVAGAGKTTAAMQAAGETWAGETGRIFVLSRNRKTADDLGGAIRTAIRDADGDPKRVKSMPLADPTWQTEIERGDRVVVDEYALAERDALQTLVHLAETCPVTLLGDAHQQRAIGTPTAAVALAKLAGEMGQPQLTDSKRCEEWRELHDDLRAAPTDEEARKRAVQALDICDVESVEEAARLAAVANETLLTISNALAAQAARGILGEVEGATVTVRYGVRVGIDNQVVFRQIVRDDRRHIIGQTGEMARVEAVSDHYVTLLVGDKGRREMMSLDVARSALAAGQAMTIDAAQGVTVERAAVILTGDEDSNALYTGLARSKKSPKIYRLRPEEATEATRMQDEDERSAQDVVYEVLGRTDRWSVLDLDADQALHVAGQLQMNGHGDLAQNLLLQPIIQRTTDRQRIEDEAREREREKERQAKKEKLRNWPELKREAPAPAPPAPTRPSKREAERPRPTPKEKPYTSPEILAQLAQSEKPEVREAVAKNPYTPPEVLAQLAQDEVQDVRWAARNNPNAPPEIGLSRDVPMPSPGLGTSGAGLEIGF